LLVLCYFCVAWIVVFSLEKYKVVLVLARTLCVMIFDIELKDIEYELPQLENFS